jgi:hypothetical protein
MTMKWGDPKLDALDVVRAALGKIYDAKRARTATAKDDVRLKELHAEWMAIMRKLGDVSYLRGEGVSSQFANKS